MKTTDIAWVAGLFDGEGCIHINRQKASVRKDIRTDHFRLYIKISMGHLPTLEKVQKILGLGNINNHVSASKNLNASYSWLAGARKAHSVIDYIAPYCVTKADEIQIAKEFFRIPPHQVGGSGGNSTKPQELLDLHLRCYWQMRMAKSRWSLHKHKLSRKERAEIKRLGL